jgi:hypothetical protein
LEAGRVHAIRFRWKDEMALRVNGKDMKDAVLKTDQFELRILDFLPDRMKVQVKESSGHPFNFVPRFFDLLYPEKVVAAKDMGIMSIGSGKTVEQVIEWREKIRIEVFLMFDLRYARRKLATLSLE